MNCIKDMGDTTYEIKKIVLADGTEFDIDKITGLAVVKESGEGLEYNWKITYCAKGKNDLLALSNQCTMMAHAFKFMREKNIEFDEACTIYDKMLEEARKIKEKWNRGRK
ncbi:hypothetical protein M0R36_11330 [bacterium]|jgi:hypothetical protein|nr:hypothetical protein [bacterium]